MVSCGSRLVAAWCSGSPRLVEDRICSWPINGHATPGHMLIRSHQQLRGVIERFVRLTTQFDDSQRQTMGHSGRDKWRHIGVVAEPEQREPIAQSVVE